MVAKHGRLISHNTVQLPVLANGIALYGGRDNAIMDNMVADIVMSGGGIHIGNRFMAIPLAGSNAISRNTVVRSGCLDMNWNFGVGAVWFYALDRGGSMDGTVVVSQADIIDSPYEAIFFVGASISNVKFENSHLRNAGSFGLQIRSTKPPYTVLAGGASFENVTAEGMTKASVYNCAGNASAGFAIQSLGGGGGENSNAGLLLSCTSDADCKQHAAVGMQNTTCQGPSATTRFCAHCGF